MRRARIAGHHDRNTGEIVRHRVSYSLKAALHAGVVNLAAQRLEQIDGQLAISRAVDTAEVVRNRFLLDVTLDHIEISTEELTSEKGERIKVSSIEIFLKRP